jgi:hypothetical protein
MKRGEMKVISTKNYKNPYLVPKPIPFPSVAKPNQVKIGVFEKHKETIIKLGIAGGTILLVPDIALANSGIDAEARNIYFGEFIGIAKWIIVIKGGWDTLNRTLKEDFDGAKKSFLQYLIVFAILLGLPTGLEKIQGIFERMNGA